MAKQTTLGDPNEEIEVVMKKNMTRKEYYQHLDNLRKKGFKGWSCQGYEKGYYQGEKASIKVEDK